MTRIHLLILLWFVIPEINLYTNGEKEIQRTHRISLRTNKKFSMESEERQSAAFFSSVF